MALPRAGSGQVIDVRPLSDQLRHAVTTTLVKSEQVEVIRLIRPNVTKPGSGNCVKTSSGRP